jgi:DNA-binding NtrC family response regulator
VPKFSDQTTLDSGGGSVQEVLRLRQLRVVYGVGDAAPPVALLDRSRLSIGREGKVDGPLGLSDREVSRVHAHVDHDDAEDAYVISDAGSRNGVFLNGRKLEAGERARLGPGAVVRVGTTLLVYVEIELPRGAALAPERGKILGASVAAQRLRAQIAALAPSDLPVLVLGPTGAGKELVAEELHLRSGRTGPLVPVNCAALPEALAEAELFGHEAGAFTGAARAKEGLWASAHKGTLFLDEVGELAPPLQAKLLRALATGEVRRVGAQAAERFDARVVAATHRDLGKAVGEDDFRADLLARLSGATVRVPSLAERREDVLALAAVFLERAAPGRRLGPDAAEALLVFAWPFNVRQLEQTVRAAAVAAGSSQVIEPDHLPSDIMRTLRTLGGRGSVRVDARVADLPLELLVPPDHVPDAAGLAIAMERMGGTVSRVADYFGKDRRQVYRWLERDGGAA